MIFCLLHFKRKDIRHSIPSGSWNASANVYLKPEFNRISNVILMCTSFVNLQETVGITHIQNIYPNNVRDTFKYISLDILPFYRTSNFLFRFTPIVQINSSISFQSLLPSLTPSPPLINGPPSP